MTAREAALASLLRNIAACRHCTDLPLGPRPVLRADTRATLLIIGQAPGTRVHESGIPWHDASGDRLRAWLALTEAQFYDPSRVAILPVGLCYPGRLPRGGDRPPRPACAPLWHASVLALMPRIRLTLLVGAYAQALVLGTTNLTRTVADFRRFLPARLPLPHPSWRTIGWQARNPWFESDVLPALRQAVQGHFMPA